MSDSLRDDVYKAIRNAGCKPKFVELGEGRPSKSWLEINTENVKLQNDKERMGKQLKEQGELIHRLKQEVEDKETEIQKLLSIIDNLKDDLREYKTHEPQYFYNG